MPIHTLKSNQDLGIYCFKANNIILYKSGYYTTIKGVYIYSQISRQRNPVYFYSVFREWLLRFYISLV
jgi:hypothetical protein